MGELTKLILEDGVGELVLDRPQQRNSLTGPLVDELQQGLDKLLAAEDCTAIVIRGAEGYFCAGLDLKAFSADPAPAWRAEFQQKWTNFHRTIFEADKPIIGALQGFAIAGGSALALACDFLVVGETAFLHVSEVERNMMAPLNIFWLAARYNYHVGLRMALLGQRHTGEEIVRLGIAERCVADDSVVATAREIAGRFASFDSANVRQLKRSIRRCAVGQGFDELLAAIKSA